MSHGNRIEAREHGVTSWRTQWSQCSSEVSKLERLASLTAQHAICPGTGEGPFVGRGPRISREVIERLP
jgi:hypothetical protein